MYNVTKSFCIFVFNFQPTYSCNKSTCNDSVDSKKVLNLEFNNSRKSRNSFDPIR